MTEAEWMQELRKRYPWMNDRRESEFNSPVMCGIGGRTMLSERIRPDVEAAPWVIDEVKKT